MKMAGKRGIKITARGIAILVCAGIALAQQSPIDTEKSVLTVRVFKAGLLSGFGHEHQITAPVAGGAVDRTTHRVELRTSTRFMKVADQGISDKDRAEIQNNMLGPQVLDAEHYPEIAFRSTGATPGSGGSWTVNGTLSLHGQTREVAVEVREQAGHYIGTSRFKQSDFGIKPIRIAGGAVQVKDEIRIEFDIQLAR